MLLETRRHNQELQTQRKLAESAENSRTRELEARIGQEFAQVRSGLDGIAGRFDGLAQSLAASLTGYTNGLAALVGEMNDKLDRVLQRDKACRILIMAASRGMTGRVFTRPRSATAGAVRYHPCPDRHTG